MSIALRPFPAPPGVNRTRLKFVAIWLLVAVLGYCGVLEFFSAHGPLGYLDDEAVHYLASSEAMAGLAFAAARTISAAVSVMQSANFSVLIFNIEPMQALEPIGDLARQFADVMLVSITAIFLQQTLLVVSQAWALTIALPIGALLLCFSAAARPTSLTVRLATIGRAVIILAVFARFAVPVAGWVGHSLSDSFLAQSQNSNMATVNASADKFTQMRKQATPITSQATPQPPLATPPNGGTLWEQARKAFEERAGQTQQIARSFLPDEATISDFLTNLPTRIVRLIAIFVVQTIITPLLTMLVLYHVTRTFIRPVRLETIPAQYRIEAPPRTENHEDASAEDYESTHSPPVAQPRED